MSEIVGREPERARVDAFLGSLAEGAHALVIRGDPGIGKTSLWRHALELSRRAGDTVLVTRPAEDEMPLALVGLGDLFEQVEIDAAGLDTAVDPVVRGRAVLDALRRCASRQWTIVAIDDAQWLDSVSARALRYVLRRLDTEPVGVLTTVRSAPWAADPLAPETGLPPGRTDTLDLGPLDITALRRVVGRVVSTISRPSLNRIHELSGGNPLYALELARAMAGASTSGRTRVRLPGSLQAAVAERIEKAPAEVAPLLETVSALGGASVAELRAALPDDDVDRLVTVGAEHELIHVDDDLHVELSHPVLGSVVYERMSALARRALHARLASVATDPDVRARHLALSTEEPDGAVAALLEEAGERARASGAFDLAAEFAGHSVRLTPPEDDASLRRRSLAEIAQLGAAGEVGRALELADRLVARLPRGPARAEALVGRAQLEGDDLEQGEALLAQALEDAEGDDVLRGKVLDQLGWLRGMFRGDVPRGIADMREALAIAVRAADTELEMSAASGLAYLEFVAGVPRPELFSRAVALEAETGRPLLWGGPRAQLAAYLRMTGDLAGARGLYEAVYAECVSSGNERWRPYALHGLARLECQAGELVRAEALLEDALEAAHDDEDAQVEHWMGYSLALVAVWRGRVEEARAKTAQLVESAERRGARPQVAQARSLQGLLALSLADSEAAVAELESAVQLLEEMGYANPATVPAVPDAIVALASSGRLDEAQALLDRLDEQALSLGNDLVRALLDRSRGVVLLARGEAEAALAPLERAAETFDRIEHRLEAARAVLALGQALLRAGHRSRAAETLADARARFTQVGAQLWEARAAQELERAAPGRAAGELTRTERRVAALVAEGGKNREIGQALFMSVATVEAHLTRIYRKLDIRSRSELTRLVASGDVELADEHAEAAGSEGAATRP